jgi:hypothetical protein
MSVLARMAARALRRLADRLAPAPEPAASPAQVVGRAMPRAEVPWVEMRARCLAAVAYVELEPEWVVRASTGTLQLLNLVTEMELAVRAAAWDEVERTWR